MFFEVEVRLVPSVIGAFTLNRPTCTHGYRRAKVQPSQLVTLKQPLHIATPRPDIGREGQARRLLGAINPYITWSSYLDWTRIFAVAIMDVDHLVRILRTYDASFDTEAVRVAFGQDNSLATWAATHLTPDTLLTTDELLQ